MNLIQQEPAASRRDGQYTRRSAVATLSPANELASAVTEIMRAAAIGMYSSRQIIWWEDIVRGQQDLVDAYWNLSIDEICTRTDLRLNVPSGSTKNKWSDTIVLPGLQLVASILAKVTSGFEHAPLVRQHLAAAGLTPEQAATRLSASLPAMTRVVANRFSPACIKSICAPVWEPGTFHWLQRENEYKDVMRSLQEKTQLFGGPSRLHPITTGTWRIVVGEVNAVLNAPILCKRLEIDVTNRAWPESSLKIGATMLAHPTAEAIDRLVLKTIVHSAQGADAGIVATQKYLQDQAFDGIASPVFIVEVLEKTSYMDSTELSNAFVAGLGGAYNVCNVETGKLGTLVWNSVPAPWLKAADEQTLPAATMERYNLAKHKIDKAVSAIASTVRQAERNPSMASINLAWERSC